MPPPRTPLRSISTNQTPRKELSPRTRGYIQGLTDSGATPTQISRELRIPKSTIQDTIIKAPSRPHGKSKPRSGRPIIYTDREARRIIRYVRENPRINYLQLRESLGTRISKKTIYRVLKSYGITNWRAKRRPELTEEHAKARLEWAKDHINWTEEDWSKIIWSDECSVEKGAGNRPSWVFRSVGEKWDKDMIDTYSKGKALSQMIWGAFSGAHGRSEIYVLERDFESKKHGYSARSYLDCLEEMMPQV
jgi:hypothetical protein